MAVKTKAEILETIRSRVGDSTDDETLEFLEDVTDTLPVQRKFSLSCKTSA